MKVVKPGSTALFPVPAVMVSCGIEEPNIITLAWVGTVCSRPPSVGIGVRPQRHSHGLIVDAGEFVVNLPSSELVGVLDYCGQVSGREVNKWEACGLTPAAAEEVRTPLIAECPVALECVVTHRLDLGAHDLFVGEVVAVQVDESVLDEQGRIDYERAAPLAYIGGYYRRIGELLGRHGDWHEGPA
jgi:flavin reductase (DIM6/NTAB) family NADH-FMN oxidoreductase RutF